MLKRFAAVVVIAALAVSFGACKKKEAQPQLPPGHTGMQGGMPAAPRERTVNVPKDVKAKWTAAKLVVEDKPRKTTKEFTVNVGSELAVPNTDIKIKVLAFLPDFKMSDTEITSVSNKPNNPAVQVAIDEPGKPEWKGWLFAMQPGIHSYPSDKIGVTLMGGVSK